jgi:hypothetical protein
LFCHFDNQYQATLLTFRLVCVKAILASNRTDKEKTKLVEGLRMGTGTFDRVGSQSSREFAVDLVGGNTYVDMKGRETSAILVHYGENYTVRVLQMCMMC